MRPGVAISETSIRATALPFMIMLMADPNTEAQFRKEGCTTDLDKMRREVEVLRDLYKPTRPIVPLGLSALGDGNGWNPTWEDAGEGYTQEEWDAWDARQNPEHAERQRLDAIGKGEGKGGKAKGWQKGKGKDKDKDIERVVRDPDAAETRECYNCHKTRHLERDCPDPPFASTQAWTAQQQQRPPQGQARSLAAEAPPTCVVFPSVQLKKPRRNAWLTTQR